jgi:hypothetical protein
MNCYGFYEAEVVNPDGEIVQQWKSKNIVNYGFIGGLFKHLFDVGNTNSSLPSDNVSRTPYVEKAQFLKLHLFQNSGTPTASESDNVSSYTPDANGNSTKNLSSESDGITYSSVVIETSPTKKITMTVQVTYGPNQGLITGQTSSTWYSMGISSLEVSGTTKLLSRVLMGAGITKTNSQTLRVRYNFSIVVT